MESFEAVLNLHAKRYPKMTPQDYGKLCYQSEFGPEHMVTGKESLLTAALLEEWGSPGIPELQLPEPVGNGLFRFHLSGSYDPQVAAPLLIQLFVRTAQEHKGSLSGLIQRLSQLHCRGIPGMEEWLLQYRSRGFT